MLKAVFLYIEKGCQGQLNKNGCRITVSGRGKLAVHTRSHQRAEVLVALLDALSRTNNCLTGVGFASWQTGNGHSSNIVYIEPVSEGD